MQNEAVEVLASLITHKHHAKILKFHFVRLFVISWSLSLMVLASAYTSILFSEKLAKPNSLPFRDFETFVECLEQGRCRMIQNSLSASSIQSLTGIETEFGRRIQATWKKRPVLIKAIPDIPQTILDEKNLYLVWITDKADFDKAAQNGENCKFYAIEAPYKEIWAFPIRKKSPLRQIFNKAAGLFQENGIAGALLAKYGTLACNRENSKSESKFDLSTTSAALCLCGAGMLAAMVAFYIEIFLFYKTATRKFYGYEIE